MSTSTPIITPEIEPQSTDRSGGGGGWLVTVFDNDYNTYDEVMMVLLMATGCDQQEAAIETWEIDHLGSSVVHRAGREECDDAAQIIARIGIRVEVSEDE
ncbi:MAG: ATP-dependent Clp protease adaptor ClpS [Armatimonadetes bacterium]|nr:ATP-dependent Clp protease adaptor ClpS [Armatimonadota bacterium]